MEKYQCFLLKVTFFFALPLMILIPMFVTEPMLAFKLLYSLQLSGEIVTACSTADGGLLAIAIKPHKNYPASRLKEARKRSLDPPCIIGSFLVMKANFFFNILCY
jgi:hypothetical protein